VKWGENRNHDGKEAMRMRGIERRGDEGWIWLVVGGGGMRGRGGVKCSGCWAFLTKLRRAAS
jgi:hypothetical protein